MIGLLVGLSFSSVSAKKFDKGSLKFNGNKGEVEAITKQDYIAAKGEAFNVSFEEASNIVEDENEKLILQYCLDHGIDPCSVENVFEINSITYQNYQIVNIGGELVYLWYVSVYAIESSYVDGIKVGSVKYGATGRVIQDSHSKTFSPDGWVPYSNESGSGVASWHQTFIVFNWEDYTHVYTWVEGNVEISYSDAVNIGISAVIEAGYTRTVNNTYRYLISEDFRQTP